MRTVGGSDCRTPGRGRWRRVRHRESIWIPADETLHLRRSRPPRAEELDASSAQRRRRRPIESFEAVRVRGQGSTRPTTARSNAMPRDHRGVDGAGGNDVMCTPDEAAPPPSCSALLAAALALTVQPGRTPLPATVDQVPVPAASLDRDRDGHSTRPADGFGSGSSPGSAYRPVATATQRRVETSRSRYPHLVNRGDRPSSSASRSTVLPVHRRDTATTPDRGLQRTGGARCARCAVGHRDRGHHRRNRPICRGDRRVHG